MHGLDIREVRAAVRGPRPGGVGYAVALDRLAALTGRRPEHLALALPELRDAAPDWTAWRHQPQSGCTRCDAHHEGGPVFRLLPHHRYVCRRHRCWIGPPDYGQAATLLDHNLGDIVLAQRRHERLVHRYGTAAAYDAVLTGFLICGHRWGRQPQSPVDAWFHWTRRADQLIPHGSEHREFSTARLFAAVYPEAVSVAVLIASPTWRRTAGSDDAQRRFRAEIGRRLGCPNYRPDTGGDAITHWMQFDSWRPPSGATMLFPNARPPRTDSVLSWRRNERSATWFAANRRGGRILLHHRHLRPILIRDWSPPMDGIDAAIWASQAIKKQAWVPAEH